jgi:phospholipid transport system substrate-binding protein
MLRRTSIALLALALIPLPLAAADESAQDAVKQSVDQILRILQDPTLEGRAHERERRAKIRSTIAKRFDFEEMAKRSLATHWASRSGQDRLERTYMDRIESYSGEPIVYLGESANNSHREVRSKLITKSRQEVPITYRLLQRNGDWKVYDLIIEGVSLVNNYRTQFNRIIGQASYSDLVRRMREERLGVEAESGAAAPHNERP